MQIPEQHSPKKLYCLLRLGLGQEYFSLDGLGQRDSLSPDEVSLFSKVGFGPNFVSGIIYQVTVLDEKFLCEACICLCNVHVYSHAMSHGIT